MAIHYFACGMVLIHRIKEELHYKTFDYTYNDDASDYVESVYLVTTTITSVGYGDFKGFFDDEEHYAEANCIPEMLYLYTVTLFGIILFSSVTKEIFTYKKLYTV